MLEIINMPRGINFYHSIKPLVSLRRDRWPLVNSK